MCSYFLEKQIFKWIILWYVFFFILIGENPEKDDENNNINNHNNNKDNFIDIKNICQDYNFFIFYATVEGLIFFFLSLFIFE